MSVNMMEKDIFDSNDDQGDEDNKHDSDDDGEGGDEAERICHQIQMLRTN